jgi:opacity protein-like surface antigen
VIIPGPARIKLETKNIRGHIAARGGVRLYDILTLEAIAGFAFERTELKIRGGGLQGRDTDSHPGFVFGGRLAVRPIALFDLYSQYTVDVISADVTSTDLQAGIELNFSRNIAVFTGYRLWQYKEESMDSGSDVDIDVSGPMAGLSLRF